MRTLLGAVQGALASPARHPRTAVAIGRLLGAGFLICFGTGLYSHFLQDPLPWMTFATRPTWLYRVTQGVHVVAGTACIPLLLAKLWTVYPLLFVWPPVKNLIGLLERASIALFVAASLVELTTGLLNTYQYYPWPFSFRQTHFALAWVIVASLAIHIGVKLPIIARWWRRGDSIAPDGALLPVGEGEGGLGHPRPQARGLTGAVQRLLDGTPPPAAVSRRTVLAATGIATAAVVATTAGQAAPALAGINLFGARRIRLGPQGLPINKSAKQAGVVEKARDPAWTLTVEADGRRRVLTLDELRALPQTSVSLPISCVEGWSTGADWRGVRVRDLLAAVGGGGRDVTVRSFATGAYSTTLLEAEFADDPLTLVALELNGGVLHVDHGYPARLISPARPGVLQTKWLQALVAR